MPNIRFFERAIKTLSYASNETQSFDLPRNYAYVKLNFRLAGTLAIGTAAATALKDRNPLGLIKNVKVIADGKNVIKSLSGSEMHEINIIDYGVAPLLTPTGLTVASHAFVAFFSMDFAFGENSKGASYPLDSVLQSAKTATLQCEVQWGTTTDLATPDTTTTLSLSSTTLEVTSVEAIGINPDEPKLLNKEYLIEHTVAATSTDLQIDLPVGNTFRRFVLITTDAGVRESDIINNITLKSGQEVFYNIKGPRTQNANAQFYKIASWAAGVYVIDLARYGSIRDVLDVSKASSLELVLDVTIGSGTTKIKVIPQEVISPVVK